jgi:hypothetical protein
MPTILKGHPPHTRDIVAEARWLYSLRQGRWKYIYRLGPSRKLRSPKKPDRPIYVVDELYDLEVDPHETRNLARLHPEKIRAMRQALLSRIEPGGGATARKTDDLFTGEGLRLSLRLWGGSGPHRLQGRLSCDGQVVVRSLRGPNSHAAYQGKGHVAVQLKSRDGVAAEVELEFISCLPSSIKLDLRLDGRPVQSHQIAIGPIGLSLMQDPGRLPLSRLAALISRTPPPILPSATARLHLWLGSSYGGSLDIGSASKQQAARLADQMLRDAGYSKGPRRGPRLTAPRPPAPRQPVPRPPAPPGGR